MKKIQKLPELIILALMTIVSFILLIKDYGNSSEIISSACSISSYFNCSVTTGSELSHIMGVPLSYFGFILSLLLFGSLLYSVNTYNKLSLVVLLNGFLSLVLFLYSLIVLQGLCPFCFIYQICSMILVIFIIIYEDTELNFSYFFSFGLIFSLLVAIPLFKEYNKEVNKTTISKDNLLISILEKKTKVGEPLVNSNFWLMRSTENFLDAKIRVSVFSDFQCPACKRMSEDFSDILAEYEGDINFQYINYPLDSSCNKNISIPMHPQACLLSKIFICSNDKIYTYKDLFSIQSAISDELLEIYVKEYGLEKCVNSEETAKELEEQIQQGIYSNIEATPTIIINGLKFEGLIKPEFLRKILDYYKGK